MPSVEVDMLATNLAHVLSQMRMWLDHMNFQVVSFKQISETNIYRVEFESDQEARAFAEAFSGQVLDRTTA